jgi:poly [ADP-ribose] polymerase 7/11/12/13
MLFHGTKTIHPSIIYEGTEEGFDLRLSNVGLWGRGVYFAEQASYSNNGYSHTLANGNKCLLLALVLVGVTYVCDPNNKLTKPPLIAGKKKERYDSVKSRNQGIYVIYNNNRAYPLYYLEYR